MMQSLAITVHEQVEDDVIGPVMAVMASAFDPRFGEAWTETQLRSMLSLPGTILTVGRLGERVVGFGLLRAIAGEAELLLLAVDPASRGAGHGRRILDRCLIAAEQKGAETVFLEVREGNPAIFLYRKAGFNQYNQRKDYYSGSEGERYNALSFKVALVQI